MKFQPDTLPGVNMISRQEPGRVWVGGQPYDHPLVVPWVGEVARWDAAGFDALQAAHFDALRASGCEVVIFGSGARLRFPAPALLRSLIDARIGIETMDTPAACRTYNVLAAEGRRVLAALLLSDAGDASRTL